LLKQRGRFDPQPTRQLEQRFHADIALAALDPADIVGVEAGTVGQLLLGQVERLAQAARLASKASRSGSSFAAAGVAAQVASAQQLEIHTDRVWSFPAADNSHDP
jgi:hypothetical protein